jgi:hypothetical protein
VFAQTQALAGLHTEQVADGGDEVLVARRHELHDAPSVLLVDEGDPLEDALERRSGEVWAV